MWPSLTASACSVARKVGTSGSAVPWTAVIKDSSRVIPQKYIPQGFQFTQDPSKMRGEHVRMLLVHFKKQYNKGEIPLDFITTQAMLNNSKITASNMEASRSKKVRKDNL